MMNRITTAAANTQLLSRILKTQERFQDSSIQVSTEKKSQDYEGIFLDSRFLITTENQRALLKRYINNNTQVDMRLNIQQTTIATIEQTIIDFRKQLQEFSAGKPRSKVEFDAIQENAFLALKSIGSLLNTAADGRYLFGGARNSDLPADLDITTVSAFQSKFDGARVTIPTTRDAHLENFSFSANPADGDTTWLQFEQTNSTSGLSRITSKGDTFKNVSVGTTITISGTASNDGTYTVSAVDTSNGLYLDLVTEQIPTASATQTGTLTFRDPDDVNKDIVVTDSLTSNASKNTFTYTNNSIDSLTAGTKFTVSGTAGLNGSFTVASIDTSSNIITIETNRLTDEGSTTDQDGTITATSYYKGDSLTHTHRINEYHSIDLEVNGGHAAFEKALRAMKLIAQGIYGSEGGLDHNLSRTSEALYLLNSSLSSTTTGDPPFGTELSGNMAQIASDTGYSRSLIDRTNKLGTKMIAYFESRIADIENVDRIEAMTKFNNDSLALQTSYQVLARVRQLSLTNFI